MPHYATQGQIHMAVMEFAIPRSSSTCHRALPIADHSSAVCLASLTSAIRARGAAMENWWLLMDLSHSCAACAVALDAG